MLNRQNVDLAACDGYFAAALQEQVRGHVSPRALSMVGFFTDGLRTAFGDWVLVGVEPYLSTEGKVQKVH